MPRLPKPASPARASVARAQGVVEAWPEAGRFVEAYNAVADRGYELVA